MSRRTDRVAEAIRRITSEILHSQLRDPRTAGFITITKVEVTPDMRIAKIYYSVLGDEKKKKQVFYGLKSAKSFIRKNIASELKLHYAPDIILKPDNSQEYRQRIDQILNKVKGEAENEKNRRDNSDN